VIDWAGISGARACGSQLLLIVLAILSVFGCSRRAGLNFDCQWVPDPAFTVDLRNKAHVAHLLDDLRTAEELDIRYRDRLAGWRLVETFGIVSRHGRQGASRTREVVRQGQEKCLATLFQTIVSTHGVAVSDLEGMRPKLADRGFNLPVTIPIASLLIFALWRFMWWTRNRFEADEWIAWVLTSILGSLVIPAIVLGFGSLWAMLVEVVRLGNEHVGYRRPTWGGAIFLVIYGLGVAGTWICSALIAIQKRAASRPVPAKPRAS
jgi:hypothetical protein